MANSLTLDFMKVLYGRFSTVNAITSLVPASNMRVNTSIPPAYPALCIRPGTIAEGDFLARNDFTGHMDLHVWAAGTELDVAGNIEAAIRQTLKDGPWSFDTYHVVDLAVDGTNWLVDPTDGATHVVMTIRARVVEAA